MLWKHFHHNHSFVWGIHQSLVYSPHKGQWCEFECFLCWLPDLKKQQSYKWFKTLWHSCGGHVMNIFGAEIFLAILFWTVQRRLQFIIDNCGQTALTFSNKYHDGVWLIVPELANGPVCGCVALRGNLLLRHHRSVTECHITGNQTVGSAAS